MVVRVFGRIFKDKLQRIIDLTLIDHFLRGYDRIVALLQTYQMADMICGWIEREQLLALPDGEFRVLLSDAFEKTNRQVGAFKRRLPVLSLGTSCKR